MSTVDYFGIAKEIAQTDIDKQKKARADLEYLITIYGLVAVAHAAFLGLAHRERDIKP